MIEKPYENVMERAWKEASDDEYSAQYILSPSASSHMKTADCLSSISKKSPLTKHILLD